MPLSPLNAAPPALMHACISLALLRLLHMLKSVSLTGIICSCLLQPLKCSPGSSSNHRSLRARVGLRRSKSSHFIQRPPLDIPSCGSTFQVLLAPSSCHWAGKGWEESNIKPKLLLTESQLTAFVREEEFFLEKMYTTICPCFIPWLS